MVLIRFFTLFCLLLGSLAGPAAAAGGPRYRVALLPPPINKSVDGPILESFAVERVLQAMGIPYDKITVPQLTTDYPLAILAGPFYNYSMAPGDRETLDAYIADGGNLLGTHIEGNGFWGFFGLGGTKAARNRFSIHFAPGPEDSWLHLLDNPRERVVSLGNAQKYPQTIWTLGYKLRGGRVLATYDDGSATVVVNQYGKGRALVMGVDLLETVLRAQVDGTNGAGRQSVNSFEPAADVLIQVVKQFYAAVAQPAVYWHSIPDGKDTAIVLSHDIDATESFSNAVEYANLEKTYGVFSTMFVNTRNFKNRTDTTLYDETRIPFLTQLKQMGFEIGSHTVSHSRDFAQFPVGDPKVTIGTYDPVNAPTVMGEVKVSKDLLERDLPGQHTVSFRSGDLGFPDHLIEVLQANGYLYDSTFSASSLTTNYPYFAFLTKRIGGPDNVSKVVEIPITTDDSQVHLISPTRDQVFQAWSDIIEGNRANNGVTCMLIHPTDTTYNLDVEKLILDRYARQNVWIGPVGGLGEFWSRRAGIGFKVETDGERLVIHLDKKRAEIGADLALVVANQASPSAIRVIDRDGQNVAYRASNSANGWILVLMPGQDR